ncbi:glycosyltransferase family 77 protein [Backusella circina FSU 941]|nr:glycosyltransferase family 77 protein [Backusella circina FSU 941]
MSITTDCTCIAPNTRAPKKENIVRFGEDTPVLVPDTMPTIPQDIADKLIANKDSENTVLVTMADYTQRDYVYNWIQLLKQTHQPNDEASAQFVVFCRDPKLYVHLIVAGYESNAILIPDEWTTTSHIIQRLLYINIHILLLDPDVIMLRDPRPFMNTLLKIRPDTHLLMGQRIDSGMVMIRANSRHVRRVVAQTMADGWEASLNRVLGSRELHVKEGMVVLLDPLHFANQETYVDRQLPNKLGITPYLVHLNKVEDERDLLRKQDGFWVVNEDQLASLDRQVEAFRQWQPVQFVNEKANF